VVDVVYGMARLDDSGRLADQSVIGALGWQPGDHLTITTALGAIVVQREAGGLVTLPGRGFLQVPAPLRQRLALTMGDRVLLAAIQLLDQLIIYPPTTLHLALTWYFQSGGQ
jgi:hypothetical protein